MLHQLDRRPPVWNRDGVTRIARIVLTLAFLASHGVAPSAMAGEPADESDELDEKLELRLADPFHVVLADTVGEAWIVDDDEARITIDDVEVEENAAEAVFTVALATVADREIRVDYATVAETATVGVDFTATSGTLVFAPGEVTAALAVAILDDVFLEDDDETFRVELTNAVETTIEDATGIGTILDDELCPGPELLVNPGAEARVREGAVPAGRRWKTATGRCSRRIPSPTKARRTSSPATRSSESFTRTSTFRPTPPASPRATSFSPFRGVCGPATRYRPTSAVSSSSTATRGVWWSSRPSTQARSRVPTSGARSPMSRRRRWAPVGSGCVSSPPASPRSGTTATSTPCR